MIVIQRIRILIPSLQSISRKINRFFSSYVRANSWEPVSIHFPNSVLRSSIRILRSRPPSQIRPVGQASAIKSAKSSVSPSQPEVTCQSRLRFARPANQERTGWRESFLKRHFMFGRRIRTIACISFRIVIEAFFA